MSEKSVDLHQLLTINKLLKQAIEELADFRNCPADSVVTSAEHACDKVEEARDEVLAILGDDAP